MDRRRDTERGSARSLILLVVAAFAVLVGVPAEKAFTGDTEDNGDDDESVGEAPGPDEDLPDDPSLHIATIEVAKPAVDLDNGRQLFERKCVNCHGADGAGDGPAARHISPKPTDLTRGVYKIRSTPEGKSPTDSDLFRTITRGIPGTAMPGWMGLSVDDRWQLVFYVESLAPDFEANRADPIAIPEPLPATAEMLERGHELYALLQCTQCHGDDGRGDGPQADELEDDAGNKIYPFDFSRSAKFKGGSTPRDLYRTIHTGLGGTPMKSFDGMLTDRDTWALVHYIRDLRVDAPKPPIVAEADATTLAARAAATDDALAKAKDELAAARDDMRELQASAAETRALLDQLLAEKEAAEREAAEKAAAEKAAAEKAAREKAEREKAAKEEAAAKRALRKRGWAAYKTRCAACHGSKGHGDGPAAKALDPKPRDFSDPAWQKSVSNNHIEKIMVEGGTAVGKSGVMPAQKDLADDPELVTQIRRIIRSFKK